MAVSHESTLRASSLFKDIDTATANRLLERARFLRLEPGQLLFHEGDDASFMCVVLEGSLEALSGTSETTVRRLGVVGPGEPVGEIALLLGGARSATIRALDASLLARFDRAQVGSIVEASPALRAGLDTIIRKRLERNRVTKAVRSLFGDLAPDVLRYIVDQLEPLTVARNQYLFRKGDPGDALYLVVSGSLEVLADNADGTERVVARVRRGEPIGEMALLAGDLRGASIRAGRHSELVALSRSAFERLSLRYPDVLIGITRVLVARFRSVTGQSAAASPQCRSYATLAAGHGVQNLKTVVDSMVASMPDDVRATVISLETVNRTFSHHISDSATAALESWIDEIESRHDVVFFLPADTRKAGTGQTGRERATDSDARAAAWLSICLRRCDEVLLCAHAAADAGLNELEQEVSCEGRTDAPAIRRLIILHDSDVDVPRFTRRLIAGRDVLSHYHARYGSPEDIARVARLLTGRAIGLALGGGGARGVAHVGVIRALTERGIPIDTVAGTSMGAVIAALYGAGYSPREMLARIREMFVDLNPFNDYTLPVYSLLRGRKAELASLRTFGRLQIEDLWIPFACTSSNISRQTLAVHQSGNLSKAILATTALPGVTVPVIYDGEIHVDGGVMNNLPGDLIRAESAYLISCDVSPFENVTLQSKRYPTPWGTFFKRRGRRSTRGVKTDENGNAATAAFSVPRIGTILNAAMSAGSMHAASRVREMSDLALTPPVADIAILDFKRFAEIDRRGYEYTARVLDGLDYSRTIGTARSGRSVIKPQTPRRASARIPAASLIVHAPTARPQPAAADTKCRVSTGSPPLAGGTRSSS
ncbi:MAG: hypothetical protein EA384_11105 [Spirochaetaceae bacterium]|nr:MAG: hypothetical protein EA384_11105 [Spirochaetaceae bacterium]